MILDLDGATSEPSRRWHVAVLSAAVAAASLVLLLVLVAPPTHVDAPAQDASGEVVFNVASLPSPRGSSVRTVISNPFINLPLDLPRWGTCAEGTRWGPQYHLAGDATYGPPFTVVYDRTGALPVAVVREESGAGRLILTCVSPDGFVPRINRAR